MSRKKKEPSAANTMGGSTPRRENDAYFTDERLALAICVKLRALFPSTARIIEPSAGKGAFVTAARTVFGQDVPILANELNDEFDRDLQAAGASVVRLGDWQMFKPERIRASTLLLGNPPFKVAQAHVEHALSLMETGGHIALLLRASFLATQERGEWLKESGVRYVWHLLERPSFTGGGTDGAEYAVLIWEKGYSGEYSGSWMSWR